MNLTTEQIQQILDGGSNAILTRHKNLERNKTLNEATCKLSDVVNNHDPEIDVPIELGVWDCLDDYTAKIERDLYQEILTLRQRVEELETQAPKWISVDDELPEWGVIVLVFIPERDGEDAYVTMDCMDEDFEYWQLISEDYDHAQAVGRVTDSDKMPSGVAPYTHWMPLQQPPKEVA